MQINASYAALLYPGHAAEDDYPHAEALLDCPLSLEVVHTTIGEDAHRDDALRDTGDVARLLEGAARLERSGLASVVWACTSGSFVFGLDGAREQVATLATATGVPTSSTSLAFVDALAALNIRRVALAATYPDDVVALFVEFLAAADIETVAASGLGIVTAVEVGNLNADGALRLVAATDVPEAEAVLVPDTALHTIAHLPELEATVGKPVLTANQATVWQALRLARVEPPVRPALGRLFAGQAVTA